MNSERAELLIPSVLRRDKYRCTACSVPFALAVHHIVPRGLGGLDTPRNLTTLCANCHRMVHCLAVGRRLEGRAADDVKSAVRRQTFSQRECGKPPSLSNPRVF